MQQALAFADKFTQYNFNQLIDKQESFKRIKKRLSDYCASWRADRNVNHGGITAHHRELVWALLKILPISMEYMRLHHPRRFKYAMEHGKYMLMTNRPTLCKKMCELKSYENDEYVVKERTISNLMNRLIEAGIVISKRTIESRYSKEGKGLLIELNPDLIGLFKTLDEVKASEVGEVAPSEPSEAEMDIMNGIIAALEGEEAPAETASAPSHDPTQSGIYLQHYINTNTEPLRKEIKKGDAVSDKSDGQSIFKKEVRSGAGATVLSPEQCLLLQLCATVFNKKSLPGETEAAALDVLSTHLKAAEGVVQDWRGTCIRKVQESAEFAKAKNKEKFMSFFMKKMPNVEKRAYEMVSAAIQIQAEYIKKNNYNFRVQPVKYLTSFFFKPLEFAKKQMLLNLQHPINNTVMHAHCLVRSELWRAVSNISIIFRKENAQRATEAYAMEYGKLVQLLESDACRELTAEHRETYLNRLKNQLICLFNGKI